MSSATLAGEAAATEAIATAIVAHLHPRRVHLIGDVPLGRALGVRGALLTDNGADLAILPDLATPTTAERILIAPQMHDLRAWLDHAAERGLRPIPDYDDGRFVLFTRTRARPDPAVLDAVAALIAARAALHSRARAIAEAERRMQLRLRRENLRADAGLEDQLLIARARLAIAVHERDVILRSTMWRATAPLRALLNRLGRRKRSPFDPGDAAHQGHGPTAYQRWVARHDTLDDADRAAIRSHIAVLCAPPVISVLMPVYDTDEALLRAAINSVRAQLYPHWQLCIADDASPAPHIARVIQEFTALDPRIVAVRCGHNGNISAATNAALALAEHPFVALMDHDDLLPEHALYEVAALLEAHPDADLIYSDEDQIDAAGRRTMPYFKPDWNIDLMRAHNLVSHLGVYRRSLVEQLGGARLGFEGSQDYDLALRVADATTPDRIHHIPAVLYHWRQHPTSFSKARIDACVEAARRAVSDHLQRSGQAAFTQVRPSPAIPTWTRVHYDLPAPPPRVSVIVPTRDRATMLRRCVHGILHATDYPDLELIIADNDSVQSETRALLAELQRDPRVRVLPCPGAFNFSAINNHAAAIATGALLALVNNDIEVRDPHWLHEMAAHAMRPDIGAVGARLLFPDGAVQHAGVVLGVGTYAGGPGVAGHYGLQDAATSLGYFGASVLVHEVAAVTAACMVVRTSSWRQAGGMDADELPVAFNDVDLCLRLREAGLRNLYTPYAELTHHESASRGDDLAPEHRARFDRECRTMRDRWGALLDADPFYNPNFSRLDGTFQLLGPSTRRKPWL